MAIPTRGRCRRTVSISTLKSDAVLHRLTSAPFIAATFLATVQGSPGFRPRHTSAAAKAARSAAVAARPERTVA